MNRSITKTTGYRDSPFSTKKEAKKLPASNNVEIEIEPLLNSNSNNNKLNNTNQQGQGQKMSKEEQEGLSSVLSNLSDVKSSPSIVELFETNYYLRIFKIVVLCTAFMVTGPSLILLNKYILRDLKFDYPIFLSSLGLGASALVSSVFVKLKLTKLEHAHKVNTQYWVRNILPVAICSAATLACSNSAYLYLTVSFIQMLKAFSPVLVLFIAVFFKVDKPTLPVIVSIIVICLGSFLASIGEVGLNLFGLIIFMLAAATEGIKLVITEKVLTTFKCGIIEGQYVFAPSGATSLLFCSFFFEFRKMYENNALEIMTENPGTFLAASTMGLLVNLLTFVVIQATSSVTIKVMATARSALLVLYQVYFHEEVITAIQTLGYMISLGGFGAYNYYRMKK